MELPMFDMVGKAKYDKWKGFRGLQRRRVQYVAIVKSFLMELYLCILFLQLRRIPSTRLTSKLRRPLLWYCIPRTSGKDSTLEKLAGELEPSDCPCQTMVLLVKLDRKAWNAFNLRMWHEITQVFETINEDSSVRSAYWQAGNGPSQRYDLSVFAEMNKMTEECLVDWRRPIFDNKISTKRY